MPELPEVEVTRRSFAEAIAGARISTVILGKPLRWPLGCDPSALVGQRVLGLRRRGKYLLADTSDGLLLLHLGMSGSLRFGHGLAPAGAHDHFDLVTDQGTLRLHDPRRFGAVVYAHGEQDPVAIRLLGALGMEPLSDAFSLPAFALGLKQRRTPIKQLLLAGRLVVGVGNIYACEVLFLAGIRPSVTASRIGAERVRKLHAAIRSVLARAVELGGSTLRNFSNAQGMAGHFQTSANVYGRDGQPCHACGTAIRVFRQGQRSSYFCPRCQRP
ncbi:bifunctional DNA-formamidopyrimidine glycosylase/DNA-(apurinic or apyrimidinic site) lyase [Verminephrobacter aporrectodeae subsp. tuberculatae]|uniref:bifunctional DNA-formamidopyrimidine glycosylase/DNA-(apurinic or apyrimidinic site) lyase n=1 Tax=Verminephrobacter aporrectodeae TaxID=1110389 RepID=UPI002236F966|nr:bifunctional DNA-formamidopyrimidine glycosylase/DNA-(apurinic or apyrimidinic site) lyase [Verminephrobacter aporrectodeae]MCW5221251.1 bifunctional DNA-formamidopyrimidine glycosylase/DNA-(apurinic or apyrimidinic site) lyase [Verminephrobacter aporrectodeae subsp. tuberculatae]MCW5290542.1 bifunctional DNA-formamidopyrimidine glycosylase/DNA-(apurinic or apyrimidinic site) lyase [Verminephrobacter aporrectodeae subsp. tuberculatae]